MLLLLFAPQPAQAQPSLINMAAVLEDVYPALNAAGAADLVFWTETELYEYLDEAAERLARTCGVFVSYDTSITSELNTAAYGLPANQIATVQADLGGVVLRARTLHEIEALDADWPDTVGPPTAFFQDTQGLQQIALYPQCDDTTDGLKVGLVLHVYPPTLAASSAFLAAPSVVREYFTFRCLAQARGKQSKAEMPDAAKWFDQLAGTLEQVITGYWGAAS